MNETVEELEGDEGGVWRVLTRRSCYVFDLDDMTVIRMPGPTASATINDRIRPLRRIEVCRVGEAGYWTMHPDDESSAVDYYWQSSTVIRRIQRILDGPDSDGARHD